MLRFGTLVLLDGSRLQRIGDGAGQRGGRRVNSARFVVDLRVARKRLGLRLTRVHGYTR